MEDTLPTTAQDVFDAATLGDIDRLRDLLDIDPDLVKAHGTDGFTALHLASSFGRDKAAELLLARGADAQVIAANDSHQAPLNSAARAAAPPGSATIRTSRHSQS